MSMSEVSDDNYELSYRLLKGEFIRTTLLHWTIPDIEKQLNDSKNIFFETNTTKDFEDSDEDALLFELLFKSFGTKNDLVEISFKAVKALTVKCILHYRSFKGEWKPIHVMDYRKVSAKNWRLIKAISKTELLSMRGNRGKLKLQLDFTINNGPGHVEKVFKRNLYNDLENLLNNTDFADVILKSIDGGELPAHKQILTARSDVFKAHFIHGTTESMSNIIETKFETDVLQDLLLFIYTEIPPKREIIAAKTLAAADYYQLEELKFHCEKMLCKNLTIENAVETLILADLHSASTLQEFTLKFIANKQNGDIFKTKGWESVQSVELVKRIHESAVEMSK